MHYTQAIVRRPGRSLVAGLTSGGGTAPHYERALEQHDGYVRALERCGLQVHQLAADEAFPDSTFVEDVAVVTSRCAILTAPGAPSRTGEVAAIRPVLARHHAQIHAIDAGAALDGGDVMQIGSHFYIGLSQRTDPAGARQLIGILEDYGMSGTTLSVNGFLHLKTGVTWLGDNTLIAAQAFIGHPQLAGFELIPVAPQEQGAANCLLINNHILMPAGYPRARKQIARLGREIIEIDISEFAKLDGGLTCLSLRF